MKAPGSLFLALAIFLTASQAQAVLIAYEPFDYPVGGLTGNGNNSALDVGFGTNLWTTQSGRNNGEVTSPGMTYSDGTHSLLASGNSGHANNSRNFRILDSAVTFNDGDELWISFLAHSTSAGSGHAGVALFSGNESTERATLGKSSGGTTWGLAATTGTSAFSNVSVTTESFLVYRFEHNGTEIDVDMWVSPDLGATPLVTDPSFAFSTTMTSANFDRLRVSTNLPSVHIDEIRIGTTFQDVAPIPEPASAALLAIAGFALLRFRRSR